MVASSSAAPLKARLGLFFVTLVILGALIVSKPIRNLQDFDEPYYVTLAYDLDRYNVFSNGPFSNVDDTMTRPPAGMFFGPVYPALVAAVMKLDAHFADAARCSVEADRDHRNIASCDPYDLPMRLLNAVLLAIAVIAIASTAELIFRTRWIFLVTGVCTLIALAIEANIFSYIMTESTLFCLFSVVMYMMTRSLRTGRIWHLTLSGLLLGVLCLTKPSYLVLFPVIGGILLLYFYRRAAVQPRHLLRGMAAFSLAFACLVGGWVARNAVSVGKVGFTEEYGATSIIERFAYDDMTVREFFQAFPYCTPGLGNLAFDPVYGTDSMYRFTYWKPGSFFHIGRDRRDALVAQYGRLDPQISGIIRDELRTNWWRYLLVSVPLAWCGLWAGWLAALVMVPLFVWACVRCLRGRQPLFPLYAAPAMVMLGLDALIGNHYTRYNLILIGPYAMGTASIIASWLAAAHWRWRFPASKPLSIPSARAASGADSASPTG
jgi:4-amino-4-deoxy-L-arabinose transferase-like glycosyltransferase